MSSANLTDMLQSHDAVRNRPYPLDNVANVPLFLSLFGSVRSVPANDSGKTVNS
ncbi:hypothetical protein Pmar_PMAR006331, partial [Perkinsus marinus ATCC 50983]|uniref:Uncharacterized protein n=1 Tax=Perkinsus marinus (strain ATCC 50983 / TXsc) TaxID=423536 RepID=C5K903_PERM5|eukprot:XP_002787244.1 hypothetical protein Pmar_PMAR010774 [Perkinsus marinus ATCC 50983]